jgi:thioesterase domain-containing protein
VQEGCLRAARRYRYQPCDGPATLFRAEASPEPEYFEPDPSFGWSAWITGPLDIVVVPGHHSDRLEEPYVAEHARILRERLERARRDAGA